MRIAPLGSVIGAATLALCGVVHTSQTPKCPVAPPVPAAQCEYAGSAPMATLSASQPVTGGPFTVYVGQVAIGTMTATPATVMTSALAVEQSTCKAVYPS